MSIESSDPHIPPGEGNPKTFFGAPPLPPVKEAAFEDLAPPPTFLVSLDAPADGMATDGKAFFGSGGALRPAGMEKPLDGNLAAAGNESALLLERRLKLGAGQKRTLYFAYGYLPEGFQLENLLAKYRRDLPALWSRSSRRWKDDGPQPPPPLLPAPD